MSAPDAMTAASPRASAYVVGIVNGHEIHARAEVTIESDAVLLAWMATEQGRATPWRLLLDGLDGIGYGSDHLTLYLSGGDVLELKGDDVLRTMALQLVDRACAMPELTRGLRSLGSLRGSPGAAHDAWFAPLLAARRAVAGVTDPHRQVALIDATTLAGDMEGAMTMLAAITAPGDVARQRAVEAALEEESVDMFNALERLARAADALRGASLDMLLHDWRRWVDALREVFVAADEAWGRCRTQL